MTWPLPLDAGAMMTAWDRGDATGAGSEPTVRTSVNNLIAAGIRFNTTFTACPQMYADLRFQPTNCHYNTLAAML